MDQETTQQIKNITSDIFKRLDSSEEVLDVEFTDGIARIKVQTEDPGILIGHSGQVLLAIQHVLKVILRRNVDGLLYVDLDINDYKKNKEAYLKELASEAADEVALTKKAKELDPMPAYERRIIHIGLTERKDVTTESVGEGDERRVAIQPV